MMGRVSTDVLLGVKPFTDQTRPRTARFLKRLRRVEKLPPGVASRASDPELRSLWRLVIVGPGVSFGRSVSLPLLDRRQVAATGLVMVCVQQDSQSLRSG